MFGIRFRRLLHTGWGIVFLLFILAIGVAFVTAYTAGGQDSPSFDSANQFNESEIESLILVSVNEKRASNGMPPLSENPRAATAARENAENMAEKNYFNHTSLDGETQKERYAFCDGGENIHQTWVDKQIKYPDGETDILTTEEQVAEAVLEAWMNSDPHRERGIYGEWWTSAGTGVAISEDGSGKVYSVLGFCSR